MVFGFGDWLLQRPCRTAREAEIVRARGRFLKSALELQQSPKLLAVVAPPAWACRFTPASD
jgi:hypothetical protein